MAEQHKIICKTKMSYFGWLALPMIFERAILDGLSNDATQAFHC
jgi:hypothetical protein